MFHIHKTIYCMYFLAVNIIVQNSTPQVLNVVTLGLSSGTWGTTVSSTISPGASASGKVRQR